MNEENASLDHLLWIDLPKDIDTDLGVFKLDPLIPLPVEPDENGEIDISKVTWEKIIAAVLLVLANSPSHEHADYYRQFLNALRPGLAAELTAAYKDRISEKAWFDAENIVLALRGLEPDSIESRRAFASLYSLRAAHERRYGDRLSAESYENSAEAAYGELLSDDRAPGEAWFDAGVFRYNRGDFLRAAETLEAFIGGVEPGEDRTEAERLVRLCRIDGQADVLYREAYAALTAGQIEEGAVKARAFRDRNPAGWPGWFLLGWALRLSEEWQEARECLEGARDRGCRESDLYNELAMCTRALGDFGASAAALEEALRSEPENLKVISNMAIVRMEQGMRDEALRWINAALIMEPDDTVCLRLLKELEEES